MATLLITLFCLGLAWIVLSALIRLALALVKYTVICAVTFFVAKAFWGAYVAHASSVLPIIN